MAMKKEIEALLNGRKLVDEYRTKKINRSSPDWSPPSVLDMVASLENLGFKGIDDFFLFDAKLSYQELADSFELASSSNDKVKNPYCDLCVGRLPAGCLEVCALNGILNPCLDARKSLTADKDGQHLWKSIADFEIVDPILEKQKTKALLENHVGLLATVDDLIQWWNFPNHTPPKCSLKYKQTREFDFDPLWQIGERRFAYVDISKETEK